MIVEEKGRLFSKIKIIDLLTILFLLGLTPMFYFSYRLIIQKKPAVKYAKNEEMITGNNGIERYRSVRERDTDILKKKIINLEDKIIALQDKVNSLEHYTEETKAAIDKHVTETTKGLGPKKK